MKIQQNFQDPFLSGNISSGTGSCKLVLKLDQNLHKYHQKPSFYSMNLSSVFDPDPGFKADPDLDFQNLDSDPSVYKIMGSK